MHRTVCACAVEALHLVVFADLALHVQDFSGLLELLDGLSMSSFQLSQAISALLHLG